MTSHDSFPSGGVPSLPPATTPAERRALVCSALAPRLSATPLTVRLPASRLARALLRPCAWSREVPVCLAPMSGRTPQTR